MRSIIALPNDYVIIDIETTGRNPIQDEIIEIAAIRVRNGEETDRYSQLVSIGHDIPHLISLLTGISNEMLKNNPPIQKAIQSFSEFIGDDILIGHNIAGFDSCFIANVYDRYLGKEFKNPCIDTLRISKKLNPHFHSHSLDFLAFHYNISYQGAHRSIVDCSITNACYQKMRNEILSQYNEEDFKKMFEKKRTAQKVKDIVPSCEIKSDNPLNQKVVVFTGALSMPRESAMQIAVNAGAIIKTSVTLNTSFLVVGTQDVLRVGTDGMSTKEEKAYSLNKSGKAQIQIISEKDFLRLANGECITV